MSKAIDTEFGTRAPLARTRQRLDQMSESYEAHAKPFIVVLFLICVVLPVFFFAGPLRLSPLRILLVIMFIPLLFRWLSGKYGGVSAPDVWLALHGAWMFIALVAVEGVLDSIEFFATQIAEMFGAYLLARVYIRDKTSFLYFVKWLFYIIAFLTPFAIFESLTQQLPISKLFGAIPGIRVEPYVFYEPRLGLYRAQVTFPHPILYGVFCSTAFALVWFTGITSGLGKSSRILRAIIVFIATFFSVSSGAVLSVMLQMMLMGWNWVTAKIKKRWLLLALIITVMYVAIDLASNRTPVTIFIAYATFSAHNAYYRVIIWDYGSAEVLRHPFFGIGLTADWERPDWMGSTSVDNFWLLTAMRYGIPGVSLLVIGLAVLLKKIASMDFSERPDILACQKGYMISLIALFLSICTVHIWSGTFVYVFFLIGSGVWMFTTPGLEKAPDPSDGPQSDETADAPQMIRTPYSRGPIHTR
jgi:hypothetical protein